MGENVITPLYNDMIYNSYDHIIFILLIRIIIRIDYNDMI
jgi:hypothetical protein